MMKRRRILSDWRSLRGGERREDGERGRRMRGAQEGNKRSMRSAPRRSTLSICQESRAGGGKRKSVMDDHLIWLQLHRLVQNAHLQGRRGDATGTPRGRHRDATGTPRGRRRDAAATAAEWCIQSH